jgi:hypothetical protein
LAEKRALKSADAAQPASRTTTGRTTHPVDPDAAPPLQVDLLRDVAADDLSPTVHTGVGSTGADEIDRLLDDLLDRLAEFAHDRPHTVVPANPWNEVPS